MSTWSYTTQVVMSLNLKLGVKDINVVDYDPKQPNLWRESVGKCVRVLIINVKHMLEGCWESMEDTNDPYASLLAAKTSTTH